MSEQPYSPGRPIGPRVAGHFHTVLPALRHRIVPQRSPEWEPWSCTYDDPDSGHISLSGALSDGSTDSDRLLILVHGLGGSIESHYMAPAARAAVDLGLACLRLNLRGADRQPTDLYHAGLTLDLHQALHSSELAGFRRIYVMGFSLGGHVTLKFGIEEKDERVGAVAAVCSPLDLRATVRDFDALPRYPYREYIVGGVKNKVLHILAHRDDLPGELDAAQIRGVNKLRDFDAATVVPRFGFDDTDHYYESQSVVHRLHELRRPALLLAAKEDPMISARSVRSGLASGSGNLEVVWSERGGHVAFPNDLDLRHRLGLGDQAPRSLEGQIIAWLLQQ
ncbi:MAG: alpha/beta fold hydrolase [Thermoanaerobaculia bacterium]|nr:alpha/beta fold hydrolase [Thermoanaerobaculia bacterium]